MTGHVVLIGLGNIGSALCDLLVRQPEVHRLTLVDMDFYATENLRTQAISSAEVGMPKAPAQARRLKRIRPDIQVVAYCSRVETLPLGCLQGDLICACLDSRISRMYVNEAAWRLGIPWIDAGVQASEMLARVEVFLPAEETPCLECAFGEQHYATLEVRHPCQKGPSTAPTNAPAYLGALAASLQAAECHQFLCGGREELRAGEQLLYGLRSHQHFVSRNRRNPDCRFDHRVFAPQQIPGGLLLKELLFPEGTERSANCVSLSVPGQRFLHRQPCSHCGRKGPGIVCVRPGVSPDQRCRFCGAASPVHPAMFRERLSAQEIPASLLARTPHALGLRSGDLFAVVGSGEERYYLLGPRSWGRREA